MASPDDFLAGLPGEQDWPLADGTPKALTPMMVQFGAGPDAFEVALAESDSAPKADDVRRLFKLRWNHRAAPVLVVVAYPVTGPDGQEWHASVCGTRDDPAVTPSLDLGQLDRMCRAALDQPDSLAAERTIRRLLEGTKDCFVDGGLNRGLFATHELRTGVPARPDWAAAGQRATPMLRKSGAELIRALGYTTTPIGSTAHVLADGQNADTAVAILLDETEVFERPSTRFGALSPVASGIAAATRRGLPWLIVTRGTQIRLYPTRPNVGVGRKGPAETYLELDLATLADSDAAYLTLIYSPEALTENGTVSQILDNSTNFSAALGKRLRERIYVDLVPDLAVAIGNTMEPTGRASRLTEADLHEAYHRTLIVLFRLLFTAYAEDRGLLPVDTNPRYQRKSLRVIARDLTEDPDIDFSDEATDLWEDLQSVWRAIDDGNSDWDVPAYNGGLFAADDLHPSGQALAATTLTNAQIGPALRALLVDINEDGERGPVDFRAITVREFGTIYEGLLESSLSVADADLTIGSTGLNKGAYLPAKDGQQVAVAEGQVYFHNASGQRKSTGSYFTKEFAVEHLLDTALDPTLDEHLDKVAAHLASGDEAKAFDLFFDFRVADLAMGSAHFLVAAIDRIEAKMSAFLAEHPIPRVVNELTELKAAAQANLPEHSVIEIEPAAILRRQIARRCIYGLDLNLMAVELARLGIWIHTFVPGLPMSALDHGLRVGNSLTGIGTVDEALAIFEPDAAHGQMSLFSGQIDDALAAASDRLKRVALTSEASKQDVHAATREYVKAMQDAAPAKRLLDAAVAVRLGQAALPNSPEDADRIGQQSETADLIRTLQCAHMPLIFPEVFTRDAGGFDVILGNPPWDKVKVEEHQWWGLRFPGLRSMSQKEKNAALTKYKAERPDLVAEFEAEQERVVALRSVIQAGPFPGIGSGDTDVYKAFCWRDWDLLRPGGRTGVVFPRGALSGSGTGEWRNQILDGGGFDNVVFLTNSGKWIFDEVHPQYTVGLVTIRKGGDDRTVRFRGPYHSLNDLVAADNAGDTGLEAPAEDFRTWATGAAFPLLPSARSVEVFAKMRQHPRFDAEIPGSWRFRPVAELHTSAQKTMYNFDLAHPRSGETKVLTGASFNLWDPDFGDPYAYVSLAGATDFLRARLNRQTRDRRSAFYGLNPRTVAMPFLQPRIAFRDIARATDTRTALVALIPPGVFLVEPAPYLLRVRGDLKDEAYLLGVMSSMMFDWYSRRYVELHLKYNLLNPMPVPRPDLHGPLRPGIERVVEISGRLAAVDGRYREWAAAVGVPVGSVTSDEVKQDLVYELDALVALLYGLSREDVEHIFETFHRGWDYKPRLAAVLAHFDAWQGRI